MSSDSESIIIGHHEEFAFTDSEEEKKKDVVPNHKETYKHLMWHCMIYRKALGNVPSGYQVLRATLQEMKNEDPCCVGCEEDDISKKIKNMGLKEFTNGEDEELGCANCTIDAKLLFLEDLLQQRSESPILSLHRTNRRRTSL